MEPVQLSRATLVDLIDRLLDKGLVIHADIIISVAGIPLIGVNLRAALAGMETMLAYGVMQPWDERTRAWERERRQREELLLKEGEPTLLSMPGAHYYAEGICAAWRWGRLYLTPQRIVLHHGVFNEILFQTPLEEIRGIALQSGLPKRSTRTAETSPCTSDRIAKPPLMSWPNRGDTHRSQTRELWLTLGGGGTARLRTRDVDRLKEALEKSMAERGLSWDESPPPPAWAEGRPSFLAENEEIAYEGKMWHLMTFSSPFELNRVEWKPGRLYLTDSRLCWWYGFDQRVAFEVPIKKIAAATKDMRRIGSTYKEKEVLDVVHGDDGLRRVASFSSGRSVEVWEEILNKIVTAQGTKAGSEEMETCPQCGEEAQARALLETGCSGCGWTSPRPQKSLAPARVPPRPANPQLDGGHVPW